MASSETVPCKHCYKGSIIPGEPKGSFTDIAGHKCYVTAGGEAKLAEGNARVIFIASDMFGFGIPNTQILADVYAEKTGAVVVAPDILEGEYPPSELLDPYFIEKPVGGLPFYSRVWKTLMMVYGFLRFVGPRYVMRHGLEQTTPIVEKVAAEVRGKGISSAGLIGFCLGGGVATRLAHGQPELFDAFVIAFPSRVTADDFEKITKPLSMVCAEEDLSFDSIRGRVLALLDERKAQGQPFEHKTYPGTTHGFACRPMLADEEIRKGYEGAIEQAVTFMNTHLH